MNAIKKQKLGTWLTLVVIILGIVSVIIYSVNGSVEGYFKGTNQSSVVIMSVLAIVFAVISIILAQFSANGAAGRGSVIFSAPMKTCSTKFRRRKICAPPIRQSRASHSMR